MNYEQPQHFTRAVRIAQEAGYDVKWDESMVCYVGHDYDRCLTNKEIWIDKAFWNFLGIGLKWATQDIKDAYKPHRIGSHSDDWGGDSDNPCYCDKPKSSIDYWIDFIRHLDAEKDPEEFFRDILPKP